MPPTSAVVTATESHSLKSEARRTGMRGIMPDNDALSMLDCLVNKIQDCFGTDACVSAIDADAVAM